MSQGQLEGEGEGEGSLQETTLQHAPPVRVQLDGNMVKGVSPTEDEKISNSDRSLNGEGPRRALVRIPSPVPLPHTQQDPAPSADRKNAPLSVARQEASRLSGTATHAILDMQAYSPPRMVLQSGKGRMQRDNDVVHKAGREDGRGTASPGRRSREGRSLAGGTDKPIGSPPRKVSSQGGRGHKVSPAKSAVKSPVKMAFNADVQADDESDVIMIDDDGNDIIKLNSPERLRNPSDDNHIDADNLLMPVKNVPKRRSHQGTTVRAVSVVRSLCLYVQDLYKQCV